MKKVSLSKIVISLLVVILIVSSIAFAKNFSDLKKDHWAYDMIQSMQEEGYLKGYEDGTFKPEKEVTREEFMQMLYNVNGRPKATSNTMQKFEDIEEDRWSYKPVQVYGYYLKETSDGYTYLYPTRPIQRQEVAYLINEIFELDADVDGLTTKELKSKYTIKDASSINKEYEAAVYNTYYTGYMKGMSDTEFSPSTSLTRAQAATLLARIIKLGEEEEPEEQEPVLATKDLDVEFMNLENKKANLVYSPYSIRYALVMLSEGAKGTTKSQIDNLVGGVKLTNYKSSDNLSMANSFFIRNENKDEVRDEYIKLLKEKYNAEIVFDDFKSAVNANKWIEDRTLGLLKNVLSDDIVTKSVSLLMNAIAMDMEWQNQFADENTKGREFIKEDGSKYEATTMNQSVTIKGSTDYEPFNYYMDDDLQIVVKDLKKYGNDQFEFMAIMPKNEKLSDFTKQLDESKIDSLRNHVDSLSNMKFNPNVETVVNLYIPKFKFEYKLDFKNDLYKLGMVDAFDKDKANFFNMYKENDRGENYYVGEAIHQAMVDFSEDGIKAAAVTVFAMYKNTSIAMPVEKEYINIVFDHPFFFVIRDKKTGENIFVGTVYEPNHWDDDKSEYTMKSGL